MKKMLTNNLGLKALSVIAAIMLWFIVLNIDDAVTYQDYNNIQVTLLNEDVITDQGKVYKIEDNSNVISVRVWAKRSILEQLSSSDFTATADMEKNLKLDSLVGIDVTCSNRNVSSANITKSRENVVISIEDAASEQFNVVVTTVGDVADGYMVGSAVPATSMITISGPASTVERIKRVVATVNVSGWTSDRTVNCTLTVLNSDGDAIDTTYLEYTGKTEGIDVSVSLLKTKTVSVKVSYSGTPADGYSVSSISYKPETVEIAGADDVLSTVRSITVSEEAVNVDGISEDTQYTVDLTAYLPDGIQLKDSADASIAVVVELEAHQTMTVTIPVSEIGIQNARSGYSVDFGDLEEISFTVSGRRADLDDLDGSEIAVTLDLSEYTEEGEYTDVLAVTLPDEYTLVSEVEIEFELVKSTQTNTGTSTNTNTGTNTNTSTNTGTNTGTSAGSTGTDESDSDSESTGGTSSGTGSGTGDDSNSDGDENTDTDESAAEGTGNSSATN